MSDSRERRVECTFARRERMRETREEEVVEGGGEEGDERGGDERGERARSVVGESRINSTRAVGFAVFRVLIAWRIVWCVSGREGVLRTCWFFFC